MSIRNGLAVNCGSGNASQHVRISARGLARFGLLFLNQGKWNGRQLISAEWLKAATSVQVPASIPLGYQKIDGRGATRDSHRPQHCGHYESGPSHGKSPHPRGCKVAPLLAARESTCTVPIG